MSSILTEGFTLYEIMMQSKNGHFSESISYPANKPFPKEEGRLCQGSYKAEQKRLHKKRSRRYNKEQLRKELDQ